MLLWFTHLFYQVEHFKIQITKTIAELIIRLHCNSQCEALMNRLLVMMMPSGQIDFNTKVSVVVVVFVVSQPPRPSG